MIVWVALTAYAVGMLFVLGLCVVAGRSERESRAVFDRWIAESRPPRRRPARPGASAA
jgi:hypothetical protein